MGLLGVASLYCSKPDSTNTIAARFCCWAQDIVSCVSFLCSEETRIAGWGNAGQFAQNKARTVQFIIDQHVSQHPCTLILPEPPPLPPSPAITLSTPGRFFFEAGCNTQCLLSVCDNKNCSSISTEQQNRFRPFLYATKRFLNVFIVRANRSYRRLYIQLSSAACFGSFCTSSGRFCDMQDGRNRPKHVDDGWVYGILKDACTLTQFRKKLRADWSQGMLVTTRWRTFCLPVCYPKI